MVYHNRLERQLSEVERDIQGLEIEMLKLVRDALTKRIDILSQTLIEKTDIISQQNAKIAELLALENHMDKLRCITYSYHIISAYLHILPCLCWWYDSNINNTYRGLS